MEAAALSNDTIALAFWRGRLTNIILVFEPIQVDEYNVTRVDDEETRRLRSGNFHLKQFDEEDEIYNPTEPFQRS